MVANPARGELKRETIVSLSPFGRKPAPSLHAQDKLVCDVCGRCVFIELHITAQSGPVILLIVICATRIKIPPKGGSSILDPKTSDQTRQRGQCARVFHNDRSDLNHTSYTHGYQENIKGTFLQSSNKSEKTRRQHKTRNDKRNGKQNKTKQKSKYRKGYGRPEKAQRTIKKAHMRSAYTHGRNTKWDTRKGGFGKGLAASASDAPPSPPLPRIAYEYNLEHLTLSLSLRVFRLPHRCRRRRPGSPWVCPINTALKVSSFLWPPHEQPHTLSASLPFCRFRTPFHRSSPSRP